MSGHNRKKKDGGRTEKANQARQRDLEQAVVGSETADRGSAVSNFTDGKIAGPDWKRKEHSEREG
jgi:hypothetical protein